MSSVTQCGTAFAGERNLAAGAQSRGADGSALRGCGHQGPRRFTRGRNAPVRDLPHRTRPDRVSTLMTHSSQPALSGSSTDLRPAPGGCAPGHPCPESGGLPVRPPRNVDLVHRQLRGRRRRQDHQAGEEGEGQDALHQVRRRHGHLEPVQQDGHPPLPPGRTRRLRLAVRLRQGARPARQGFPPPPRSAAPTVS